MRLLWYRWQPIKNESAEGSNVIGDDAVEAPFLGGTFNDLTFLQASWRMEAVAVFAKRQLTVCLILQSLLRPQGSQSMKSCHPAPPSESRLQRRWCRLVRPPALTRTPTTRWQRKMAGDVSASCRTCWGDCQQRRPGLNCPRTPRPVLLFCLLCRKCGGEYLLLRQ